MPEFPNPAIYSYFVTDIEDGGIPYYWFAPFSQGKTELNAYQYCLLTVLLCKCIDFIGKSNH